MTSAMIINWTVFDAYPEDTAYCRCGRVYRSHTKLVNEGRYFSIHSRKPCPGCGKSQGNISRVSSDPEIMTL